jgi:small subunit ribosomal protein S19
LVSPDAIMLLRMARATLRPAARSASLISRPLLLRPPTRALISLSSPPSLSLPPRVAHVPWRVVATLRQICSQPEPLPPSPPSPPPLPKMKAPRYFQLPPFKKGERPVEMKRPWRIEMEHAGRTFLVHNGKEMKKIRVSTKMVGHKFGEFAMTRKVMYKIVANKRGGKGGKSKKR